MGPIDYSEVSMGILDSPTYSTLKDWFDIRQEAGFITGGDIYDNGDGTVRVTGGTGVIKTTDSETGESLFFDWSEDSSVSLTDNSINYIVVQYNGGNPQIVAKQDINNINFHDEFVVGYCYREGNTIKILEAGNKIPDYLVEHCLVSFKRGPEHISGGMIRETGNRYLEVTAGEFYLGITEIYTNAIDTSGTDTFVAYYSNGAGGWSKQTGQSQVDNQHYDDGSGTLANLISNRYNVFWVYISFDGGLYLVYDQNVPSGGYKLSEAQIAKAPTNLPNFLETFSILAGKIIVQEGATNLESVESAYITRFAPSDVFVHNDLSGLQGGTTSEYYHLTSSAYNHLKNQDQEVLTSSTPTFSSLIINGSNSAANAVKIGEATDGIKMWHSGTAAYITTTADNLYIDSAPNKVIVLLKPVQISKTLTVEGANNYACLLYTSPSPRDLSTSRMPSSA